MVMIHAMIFGAEFVGMFPLQYNEIMEVSTRNLNSERIFCDLADECHRVPFK